MPLRQAVQWLAGAGNLRIQAWPSCGLFRKRIALFTGTEWTPESSDIELERRR